MAGAGFLPPVVAVLTASIGEFSAKMGQAKGEMASVEGSASKMGVLGKGAILGLAVGAGVVAVESVKMASSFQATMNLIQTQAHAGKEEVDKMSQAVLDLAPTVGIGPQKLAEGLYHVESTGLRGSAALDVLKASAQEAAIGMADFDDVTFAMSGVMSVALKDVANAADGVAYLNTIVGTGDMRMGDLAKAIGTGVLPVFKSAQLGMRDFGSAMAVMTDNSMPAEQAANHLKTAVMLLQNQSGPAAKALESIGIVSGQLAQDLAKPDGFLVAIQDIKHHLEASGKSAVEQGQIIAKAFGGARSAATIEEFIGQVDKLAGKYHEMGNVAQRAKQQQEDWAATQQTFKQKMAEVGAQFQVWLIQIGQQLLPLLSKMADWFMGSVKWLGEHKDALAIIGIILGGVVVGGLIAATIAVWNFTVALLANPITWVVLGLVALGVAIYEIVKHWDSIKRALAPAATWINDNVIKPVVKFFRGLWDDLKPTLEPIGKWFKDTFGEIIAWFKKNWPAIQETSRIVFEEWKSVAIPILEAIGQAWKTYFKVVGDVITAIVDAVKGMIRTFKGIIEFVQGVFTGDWRQAWQGIKDIFGGIWDQFSGLAKGSLKVLEDVVMGGLKSIEKLFKKSGDSIHDTTGALIHDNANQVRDGFTSMQDSMGTAAPPIIGHTDRIRDGFNLMKNGVVNAFHAVVEFAQKSPQEVGHAMGVLAGTLGRIAVDSWNNFTAGIKTAWKATEQWFSELPGNIGKFFDGVGNWLTSKGRELLEGLWHGVDEGKNSTFQWLRDLRGNVGRFFDGVGDWLWDRGRDLIDGLVHGIQDSWQSVLRFFRDLPDRIKNIFYDAPNWLFNAGYNLLVGLYNGIVSRMGWLRDQVTSWASGVVQGIKDAFGIHSPSTETHSIGMYLVQGLANGIAGNANLAVGAANAMASRVLGASTLASGGSLSINGSLSTSGGLAGGVGSGGGTTVVNHVTVQGTVVAERDLQTLIQTLTLQYNARNSSNGLAISGVR